MEILIARTAAAVFQVALALLVSYGTSFMRKKKPGAESWRRSRGLYLPSGRQVVLALIISAGLFAIIAVTNVWALNHWPEYREFLFSPSSPVKHLKFGDSIPQAVFLAVLYAFVQTGLSEEIVFRGLIAKRLIARFGFSAGNLAQSFIFALLHISLLAAVLPEASLGMYVAFFALPFAESALMVILNEHWGNGSIVPSVLVHGFTNLAVALSFVYSL